MTKSASAPRLRLHRPARTSRPGRLPGAWSTRTTSCSRSARTSSRPAARCSRPRTSATRARSTTAGRPAAAARPGHDWAIVRLGVPGVVRGVVIDTAWFKRQLPAARLGRGGASSRAPVGGRARVRRLGRPSSRSRRSRGDTDNEFAVGDERAVHPRAADDLPRRRRGPVPGARRAGAGPAVPRPARSTWPRWRTAARSSTAPTCSTRSPTQHPAARPGPDHGRGLGERPPPRRRQRLRDGGARRPGRGSARRGRHVVLRRQRGRLGPAVRRQRGHRRRRRPVDVGGAGAARPGSSPTPGTSSGSVPTRR